MLSPIFLSQFWEGKTTLIASLHFNKNSTETVQDKLRRIIINDFMNGKDMSDWYCGWNLIYRKYRLLLNWTEKSDNLSLHGVTMQESIHDRVAASRTYITGLPVRRREVRNMTAYEIISIFIGILALLMSFGSLVVAFLAFLDKSECSDLSMNPNL